MAGKDNGYRKIGEGHAEAMGRQGLAELRGAMYPNSNVAQPPSYGLYGTLTPGEVAEARRPDERDMDEEHGQRSIIADRLRQPEMSAEHSDDRNDDRERDV